MTQDDLYTLLPFVLLALVFWFLVFRPARKRQRETMQTQSSLEAGARVMLTSGIFADVVSVGDTEVEVEIAPDTVISVHRQAVGKVLPPEEPDAGEAEDDSDSEQNAVSATEDADGSDGSDDVADDVDGSEEPALPPTHQKNG